jgi:hypothetical protein
MKESVMFTRKVYMRLKLDSVADFKQRLEMEVIPLLQKQNGLMDDMDTVIEGSPRIETFDVANATFHKIASVVLT